MKVWRQNNKAGGGKSISRRPSGEKRHVVVGRFLFSLAGELLFEKLVRAPFSPI